MVYLTDTGWSGDNPAPVRWGWHLAACVLAGWAIVAAVLWAVGLVR